MKKTYQGSCHCSAVRFEADLDLSKGTFKCNCSICFKTRAWLTPVTSRDFRLLSGEKSLRDYQFGRKALHHRFCTNCGVRPFSQGDGQLAVRVNCLDGVDASSLKLTPFDGKNM